MAHLNTRRMWARGWDRLCSRAWLIAHLGCFLVTGTALVLLNALAAPADLWFWRPLILLGALLAVHGVFTLVRRKSTWLQPAVALARSGWSHIATVREALLAPAVNGVVAMPGLFALNRAKLLPGFSLPATPPPGSTPATAAIQTPTPEAIAPPAGWALPAAQVMAAPGVRESIRPEPNPILPVPPAYATWPGASTTQAPALAPSPWTATWPAPTRPQTSTHAAAQTWPTAVPVQSPAPAPTPTPSPTLAADPARAFDSFWQPASAAAPAPPNTSPASDTAPTSARPTPHRLIERDTVLIGTRRTDPNYPQWDQLDVAANTWLERRASDLDAAGPTP